MKRPSPSKKKQRSKSPENTHGQHPCPVAGLHISGCVSYIENLLRLQPHQVGNFIGTGWIRFFGHPLTLTKDKVKDIGSEKPLNAELGKGVRFIGKDAQLQSGLPQLLEHLDNPPIGPALYIPALPIQLQEGVHARGDLRLRTILTRNNTLNQGRKTITDKIAVGGRRMAGEPEMGQGRIGGINQIIQGVEQGAIKIKDYSTNIHK